MKRFKENAVLWLVLALVIIFSRAAYPWGRFFTYIDAVLIAAALLVFSGRVYTAYAAACVAGGLADIISMPFFGFHFFSYIAGVTALWIMTQNLYRDNYVTKVFIVAAAESILWLFYTVLVVVFHWKFRLHYVSAQVLPKIIVTTAAAAVIFKAAELFEERFRVWLKTMSRKT